MLDVFRPAERVNYAIAAMLAAAAAIAQNVWIWSVVGIAGLTLVLEPFLSRKFKMTPAMTLGLVCVLGLVVATAWQFGLGGGAKLTAASEPAAQSPAAQSGATAGANSYSRRDKERLADLCTQLVEFLRANGGDGGGTELWKKTAALNNDWVFMRGGNTNATTRINADLADARAAAQTFWNRMYEAGGFFKSNEEYHAELNSFFPSARDFPGQIHELQSAIDEFGSGIMAVETLNSQVARTHLLTALEPSHEKYLRVIERFQKSLVEATQRVEQFRARL